MLLRFFSSPKVLRLIGVLLLAVVVLFISEIQALTHFWRTAFHEVGFALLVAFIVWAMFEVHMAQEADAEWAKRIDRISTNVFFAVLGKDIPKELLQEARASALDTSVIRSKFNVTYTLKDATFQVKPDVQAECVLMVAVMACDMRNISQEPIDISMGIALPNPVHPALRAITKVNSFTVTRATGAVALDNIAAEASFRAQLATGDQSASYDVGKVMLAPGETVTVRADYVMAKEPEDTEILQTLYPCDGLTVTIMDTAPNQDRVLFAKAIHRRKIENQSSPASPGTKVFRIAGYLLPHQGVLIWWKKAPPGDQQQLPGVG